MMDVDKDITFGGLFSKYTNGEYDENRVSVQLGLKKADREPDQFVAAELEQKLAILQLQGGNFVKFVVMPKQSGMYTGFDVFI